MLLPNTPVAEVPTMPAPVIVTVIDSGVESPPAVNVFTARKARVVFEEVDTLVIFAASAVGPVAVPKNAVVRAGSTVPDTAAIAAAVLLIVKVISAEVTGVPCVAPV